MTDTGHRSIRAGARSASDRCGRFERLAQAGMAPAQLAQAGMAPRG